jgi:hypothetical protein
VANLIHKPGEVHYLPPDDMPGGDPQTRRHVVASTCAPPSESATLAFGSTKATEASFGATYYLLDPFASNYRQTGFDQPTYIYLSRLFSTDIDALGRPHGQIVHELPTLLHLVGVALGVGTGTSDGGRAAGSLRGRLVQFDPLLAQSLDTKFGLIVTEPRYSVRQRYQTVIPILDGDRFDAAANDVVAEQRDWIAALDNARAVIFAVPDVFTVWHRSRISRPLPNVVDAATINAIDEAFQRHFGI